MSKFKSYIFLIACLIIGLLSGFIVTSPVNATQWCDGPGEFCNYQKSSCPAGNTKDVQGSWACTTGFGGTQGTAGSCCFPTSSGNSGSGYTCGSGSSIPSYCHTGPNCGNSNYAYSSLYTCDLGLYDGCCVQCLAAQTCDASTADSYIPNGTCGWTYCPPQCNQATCGSWGTCGGGATNTCNTGNGSQSRYCSYTLYNGSSNCNAYGKAGFYQNQSCTYNNCSIGGGYACTNGSCTTHINVHVYKDYNHDGVVNGTDGGYQGVTLTDENGQTQITDSTGYAIFTNETTGNHTITITVPTDWHVLGSNTAPTVSLNTSNGNYNLNFFLTPLYSISGNIFTDNNHNANYDGGDALYTGSTTVHITGVSPVTDMTQTDGTYSTPTSLESGNYTVTLSSSLPTGYSTTTTKTWNVTVGALGTSPACAIGGSPDAACGGTNNGSISGLNFGINPPYQISGYVYNDVNKDSKYEAGNPDTVFTGGPTVKIVGPSTNPTTTTVTADTTTGLYSSGQVLLPGQYTVSYTSTLPGGYKFQTLSSYVITVGYNPACNASSSNDGTCGDPNGGSVSNLNFGLTNEITWPQPICSDVRIDGGYNEQIPSTADCNGTAAPYAIMNSSNICPNVPGILFSGNTDPQYGLGTGASTSNIVVGNSLFPEIFNFRIPTISSASYSFTKTTSNNLLTPSVSLTSICPNLTTCTLSKLTPGGVYTTTAADGPVSISVSNTDGSFDLGQKNYAFLIAGNLTFKTKLNVQDGYSAAFVSGGDIHVDGSVGETDWTSLTPDLEGFFSADKSFYIDSLYTAGQQCLATGQPKEKKLNIKGSVAVNGAGAGGSVVNNRDGCLQDLSCPTVTYTIDPVQILNPPSVLKPPYTFWQELNP